MRFETKIKIRSDFDVEEFDVLLRYGLLTVEIAESKSSSPTAAGSTQLTKPAVIILPLTDAAREEDLLAKGKEEAAAAKGKGCCGWKERRGRQRASHRHNRKRRHEILARRRWSDQVRLHHKRTTSKSGRSRRRKLRS
ncbi:unnamed protein product [Linum trigynum]|uniref:SHSP domain-containing protein n=1 Tax=Linum trigynum TaxID=586398 RepID=A0AAV2ENK7_9ROSI